MERSVATILDQREYDISNENLKFCTKMYMRATGKVNESIATLNKTFNNLTQLFFAKCD